MTGKVIREFVVPKCSRGELGHHAQRRASIGHSHRIHIPARLEGTLKPAASMISGKLTREFVPPKCNRGEFGHHAQRQASIGHSHRIHTPTRLQGTRKLAARVSLNRRPPSAPIAHRRQRKPAPSQLVPIFGDEVPDTLPLGVPHPFTVSRTVQPPALYG